MAKPTEEQRKKIESLVKQLEDALDETEGLDYKVVVESYTGDYDHFYGHYESNNWERSWC